MQHDWCILYKHQVFLQSYERRCGESCHPRWIYINSETVSMKKSVGWVAAVEGVADKWLVLAASAPRASSNTWSSFAPVAAVRPPPTVPEKPSKRRPSNQLSSFGNSISSVETIAGSIGFLKPFQPGIPYFISFAEEISHSVFEFQLPKEKQEPVTLVENVFPSANRLPVNLLKFYIHFSNPMSIGDVYSRIRILNHRGIPLELPFLELGEELWDPEHRRLTLLFDPGRIKRGLKPNREVGAPLTEGETYTLEISERLQDHKGRPLKESYLKSFEVVGMDTVSPDPYNWKVNPPKADTRDAVTVSFSESLDRALAQRVIEIVKGSGEPTPGSVTISDNERLWSFIPEEPWTAGNYQLETQTILEDMAGNSIARPFEVASSSPNAEKYPTSNYVYLPFQIEY